MSCKPVGMIKKNPGGTLLSIVAPVARLYSCCDLSVTAVDPFLLTQSPRPAAVISLDERPVPVFTQGCFGELASHVRAASQAAAHHETYSSASAFFQLCFASCLAFTCFKLSGLLSRSFSLGFQPWMDPPVPYSLRLHTVLPNLDREAAWSGTLRELFDRLWDIESECAANRAEISRLHGRLRRLEDELNQGRGWLDLLSSRLQVLEQTTQRLFQLEVIGLRAQRYPGRDCCTLAHPFLVQCQLRLGVQLQNRKGKQLPVPHLAHLWHSLSPLSCFWMQTSQRRSTDPEASSAAAGSTKLQRPQLLPLCPWRNSPGASSGSASWQLVQQEDSQEPVAPLGISGSTSSFRLMHPSSTPPRPSLLPLP